jgi:hypothetical protein
MSDWPVAATIHNQSTENIHRRKKVLDNSIHHRKHGEFSNIGLEFLHIYRRQLRIIFKISAMVTVKTRRGCHNFFQKDITLLLLLFFKTWRSTCCCPLMKQSSNRKNLRTIIRWYNGLTIWDIIRSLHPHPSGPPRQFSRIRRSGSCRSAILSYSPLLGHGSRATTEAIISDSKLRKRAKNNSMSYLASTLALLFHTVVLGLLGQLGPASGSGLLSRAKDSTPPILPFINSGRVARSTESEFDRVSEISGYKSRLNS